MKKPVFPLIVSEQGVSAKIRAVTKTVSGSPRTYYRVEYILFGKQKQEWRADLNEAKRAASDACKRIANGDHKLLALKQFMGFCIQFQT